MKGTDYSCYGDRGRRKERPRGPAAGWGKRVGVWILPFLAACIFILPGWIHTEGSRGADVLWVWSGGVTSRSVVVKARIGAAGHPASLRVGPKARAAKEGTAGMDIDSRSDADGVVTFQVGGLQPDTEYAYAVRVDNQAGPTGGFRTAGDGPMSFRICFASCATTGSSHPIFSTIKSLRPFLFIHMGDFHYENIAKNDPSLFRKAYDRVLASPRQGDLYRSTPIAYMYDDHDFGPDDCDATSPSRAAALSSYQQCVPHYALARVDGEVRTSQQAFTIGRVRFLMLDVRSERSPEPEPDGPGKTMLGRGQREWLRRELQEAALRYPLVVLVNPVPWITKGFPGGSDGWEPYSHERTLVADMIQDAGLTDRLIMLSGDAHMAALDDGTNSNYAGGRPADEKGFPVIQAAPLDRYPRIKGGPYSHGVSAPYRWLRFKKISQFGMMDLADDGKRLQVRLSCRDSEGKLLENLELNLECDRDGCKGL